MEKVEYNVLGVVYSVVPTQKVEVRAMCEKIMNSQPEDRFTEEEILSWLALLRRSIMY